jgi:hypothetical protein
VDHSIFRAFNKGAVGMIEVMGAANPVVFDAQRTNVPSRAAQ